MKSLPPKTEKEIDDLLREIKERTGLTQEEIAQKIGYNRSYLSQAKKTDSEKLYMALYSGFREVLENITVKEEAAGSRGDSSRDRLERTLENLSEDKIRSTAIIERLVALLEQQANSAQLSKNHVAGPEGRVEGNGFADVRPPAASGSSRKPGKQEGRH
jgi:transcriptional regulator with XRE-family HTH domain